MKTINDVLGMSNDRPRSRLAERMRERRQVSRAAAEQIYLV